MQFPPMVMIRSGFASSMTRAACMMPAVTSVSYTHLDVYKRQLIGRALKEIGEVK